jgi:hypothetical protein
MHELFAADRQRQSAEIRAHSEPPQPDGLQVLAYEMSASSEGPDSKSDLPWRLNAISPDPHTPLLVKPSFQIAAMKGLPSNMPGMFDI